MTIKDDPDLLTLRVGSHVFKVRCPAAKHNEMKRAAAAVAREYEHVRRGEAVADGERAALMVALKMASGNLAVAEEDSRDEALESLIDECVELAKRSPEN